MKFLLFGTGDYYNRYKIWFVNHETVALLDNSLQKQHTTMDGVEILSPEKGIKLEYDKIIILSFYVKQMKEQLLQLGVQKERIFHFYDLHRIISWHEAARPIQYYLNAEEIVAATGSDIPKILLISNELTLGGPPIALFHAAMVLKKKGYTIIYASMIDGPLRDILIKNRIPVVIDENLLLARMQETAWVGSFSLVLCNTLNFHVFLSERDTSIPIIWWLHDARFFYDGVNKDVITRITDENLRAVSVGPIPERAVNDFLPELKCGELLYGVKDVVGRMESKKEDKILRFITIGFLEDIKGQDILIQAIEKLPDAVRQKCEFYIVGHEKTLFGEKLKEKSACFREIFFMGSVDRKRIHELLSSVDVLICPSRQDSMPTVVAEAMMHGVPCLVSDVVGTAVYLNDGVDGLIFHSEDVDGLSEKILWCIMHRRRLTQMGVSARKIYETYFSMDVFEKNLLAYIHEMAGTPGRRTNE